MPYAVINNSRVYYRVEGAHDAENLPLLLIHGAPGTDHTWFAPALTCLSRQRPVIVYDHAGHGRSQELDPRALALERLVGDVWELQKALGFRRIHLLGHSFGGFIALMYALSYPEHLGRLILVGTAASHRVQDVSMSTLHQQVTPELLAARTHLWSGTIDGAIKTDEDLRSAFENALPVYYFQKNLCPPSLPEMIFRIAPRRVILIREVPRYDVEGRLKEVKARTLVVVGRHDLITPVTESQLLAARIFGAELRLFEKSGHMPFCEEPEEFCAVLSTFLRPGDSARAQGYC